MQITTSTKLLGLLGYPLGHSLSPAMHNAAAAAAGVDAVYLPLPVAPGEVRAALRGLAALGFTGVNVTIPYKEELVPYVAAIDVASMNIGALNTITFERRENGVLTTGTNSDWRGFRDDLDSYGVDVTKGECLVLGAGGSARAVVFALLRREARVRVVARRESQVQELVSYFGGWDTFTGSWSEIATYVPNAGLIVNTTPLGMQGYEQRSPIADDVRLPADAFVYDLVYNPLQTPLLRQAERAGCRYANGIGMLVRQGAIAFEKWTGVQPDLDVMRDALMQALDSTE